MDIVVKYIDELLEKSTPEVPMWNIENFKKGKVSTWNYIDGCMIKAVLAMYSITKNDKYLKFADDFIVMMLTSLISITLMLERHYLNYMTLQEKKSTEKLLI